MTTQVRSFLHIDPLPGRRDEVIAYYQEHRIIELAVERGLCLHGELVVPDDPAAPLLVTCTWPSRDAYAQWVADRPASAAGLARLLQLPEAGLPSGELADIAISTSRTEN